MIAESSAQASNFIWKFLNRRDTPESLARASISYRRSLALWSSRVEIIDMASRSVLWGGTFFPPGIRKLGQQVSSKQILGGNIIDRQYSTEFSLIRTANLNNLRLKHIWPLKRCSIFNDGDYVLIFIVQPWLTAMFIKPKYHSAARDRGDRRYYWYGRVILPITGTVGINYRGNIKYQT